MFILLRISSERLIAQTALLLLFVLIAISTVAAQITTGDLHGQVRDQTGKGLPEVKVKVVNVSNGTPASTRSNERGDFVIPDLAPGEYDIIASKEQYRPTCLLSLKIYLKKNEIGKAHIKFGTGDVRACDRLKAQIEGRGGDNRSTSVDRPGESPANDSFIFGNDTAELKRGGPRARGATVIITLEHEVSESSINDEPQQTATNPNTAGNQTVADAPTGSVVNIIDATRGSNFSAPLIEALPLGSASYIRTFDDLALLVPGVAPPPYTPGVRGPGVGFGIGTAGQFSVNGARARSNNFSVDGSDTNDPDVGVRRGGYVAQVPQSLESIQEVSISTLLWSAQVGRNSGSQVNAVSKYGGNDFHGQVYGFFNDSRLNARNFFDYTGGASGGQDPFTRTQVGVVFGGPIVRNKTHIFGSVEGAKINASIEQHFASPTVEDRKFPGNRCSDIVSSQGDRPEALSLLPCKLDRSLSLYPKPNDPGGPYGRNTYTEILPADGEGILSSIKLSHQFAERHTLNARFNFTNDNRVLPSVNRGIRSTIGEHTRSQSLSLIFDSQIASRIFNQSRFSFGRTRARFPEHPLARFELYRIFFGEYGFTAALFPDGQFTVISGVAPVYQPVGEVVIEPFSPIGVNAVLFPQGRANNTFQYADTLSLHHDNHSIKVGADIRRVQLNSFQDRLYRPQVRFGYGIGESGVMEIKTEQDRFLPPQFTPQGSRFALTGINLASLPLPTSAFQTLTAGAPDSHLGLRSTQFNFYFNDNWRAFRNLTLDYGLRYEYQTVPREVNHKIENALALNNLPAPSPDVNDAGKLMFNQLIDSYRRVLDGRTRMYDPDRNNLGPHVGVAWDPGSDGKTALRAGYGIYYDAILGAVISQSRSVFPNEVPTGIYNPKPGSYLLPGYCCIDFVRVDNGFLGQTNQLSGGKGSFVSNILRLEDEVKAGLAFVLPSKSLSTPYMQQVHLTLEREAFRNFLVSVAYVGTKGTSLTRLITPNLGATSTPLLQIPAKIISSLPSEANSHLGILANSVYSLQTLRPEPRIGSYQIFEDSASSSYHALQIEAVRSYGSNVNFTFAYTWSHAIDDVSDLFPISGAPVLAQNQANLSADRGNANFDVRHRLSTSFIWNLPFYSDSKTGAARWFGGWQLASIFQAQTGQPFTLNIPIDANLDGNVTDRPLTMDGLVVLEEHGRQRVSATKSLESYYVLRQDGVVGRNTLRGDSFINLDLALTKTFYLGSASKLDGNEARKLDFRIEFFNLFNRANFGLPIRILDAPAFGSAVDTVNPARMIQFALKYSF